MDLEAFEPTLLQLLDRLAVAVLLMSAAGRVMFANEMAKRLLDTDESADGGSVSLRRFLEDLPMSQISAAPTAIVVPSDTQSHQLVMHILPLDKPGLAQSLDAMLAIFIDPGPGVRRSGSGEQPQFGLTSAEWRVARQIGDGISVHEIAATSGVSLNTVRTHLKKVFQKIGVRRQADLVRIMTMMTMIRTN